MRGLLHIPLGDERDGFQMVAEVSLRKGDALHRRQVWAREQRMTGITAFPILDIPDVFRNYCHGFVTLLFRHIGHLCRWLEDRADLAGKATEVSAQVR